MLASELHLGVNLELDRIGAKFEQDVPAQQIDYFLNSVMLHMLEDALDVTPNKRKQFQSNTFQLSELDGLIEHEDLSLHFSSLQSKEGLLDKPSLFFSYIDSTPYIKCVEAPKVSNPVSIAVIPFNLNDVNLWEEFKIQIGNKVVYSFNDTFKNGLSDKLEAYQVVDSIIRELLGLVYWEKFGGKQYNNSFIFLTDEIVTFTYKDSALNVEASPQLITRYDYGAITGVAATDSRLTKEESKNYQLKSNFDTSFPDSVLTTISNDLVRYYEGKKFIVSRVILTYYRKPKMISLSLGSGCELSDSFCNKLVAKTAQKIKAVINSEDYEKLLNENLILG